jgi:ribose transport system permease protein
MSNQPLFAERIVGPQSSDQRSLVIKHFLMRYGTVVALAIVVAILAFTTPSFMTMLNIKNLLTQTAVLGIVAIGLTFVSIPGEMDVSMGSVVTLAGVFAVSMMTQERGLLVALGAALTVGIVVGLLNGFITLYGHVSSLIATLTIAAILDGVSLLYTGGYRLYRGMLDSYRFIGIGQVLGIPFPVIILFALVAVAYVVAHRTVYGRRLFAVGGNIDAAKLTGINPRPLILITFIIGGMTSALAGVIVTARVGTAEPFVRFGYVLDAFAVVFLGTTTSAEGEPHIPGTFLGILILGVLNNGMTLLGVPFFAQNILKGALVLITVLISSLLRQQRE